MNITKELLLTLALQCSPNIQFDEIHLLSEINSNHKPYLITTLGQRIDYKNEKEAREELKNILEEKKAVQIGPLQVNSSFFEKYGLDPMDGLDVCNNLKVAEKVLNECTAEEMEKDHFTDDERLKGEVACFISANDVGNLENESNYKALQEKVTKSFENYYLSYKGGNNKINQDIKSSEVKEKNKSKSRSAVTDNLNTPIKDKEFWDVFGDF